jgi:hypothetical protein
MEEIFLPGVILDEPESFVHSQRANFACHLRSMRSIITTDVGVTRLMVFVLVCRESGGLRLASG